MSLVQQIAQYVQENGECKPKEIAYVFGIAESEAKQLMYALN